MRPRIAAVLLLASLSQAFASDVDPWTDLGLALPGSQGAPQLVGEGPLLAYSPLTISLANAHPMSVAVLFIGFSRIDVPLYGGTFVPSPDLPAGPIVTNAAGGFELASTWPNDVPPGTKLWFQAWIADPTNPQGAAASNGLEAAPPDGPLGGTFPAHWINGGPNCPEPSFQVHEYNPDFFILRQSLCTNFEAPFLFLMFGGDKALLLDTGAGGVPVYNTVKGIVDAWLAKNNKPSIQLIVAHLHSHGDHVAGDSQFVGKPNVTLVGTSLTAVRNFFGITTWPTQIVDYDLGGGRVVDVIPIPGHHPTHIAVYDRQTGILFTGDSLYPGRLYVNGAVSQGNWAVYRTSVQRLVDFTADKPLCWVLGTHIEMSTTPGDDFPLGAGYHPNEHELQLDRSHLLELHQSMQTLPGPTQSVHDDFIIVPVG